MRAPGFTFYLVAKAIPAAEGALLPIGTILTASEYPVNNIAALHRQGYLLPVIDRPEADAIRADTESKRTEGKTPVRAAHPQEVRQQDRRK